MEDAKNTGIKVGMWLALWGNHHHIGMCLGIDAILITVHAIRCVVDMHDLVDIEVILPDVKWAKVISWHNTLQPSEKMLLQVCDKIL